MRLCSVGLLERASARLRHHFWLDRLQWERLTVSRQKDTKSFFLFFCSFSCPQNENASYLPSQLTNPPARTTQQSHSCWHHNMQEYSLEGSSSSRELALWNDKEEATDGFRKSVTKQSRGYHVDDKKFLSSEEFRVAYVACLIFMYLLDHQHEESSSSHARHPFVFTFAAAHQWCSNGSSLSHPRRRQGWRRRRRTKFFSFQIEIITTTKSFQVSRRRRDWQWTHSVYFYIIH